MYPAYVYVCLSMCPGDECVCMYPAHVCMYIADVCACTLPIHVCVPCPCMHVCVLTTKFVNKTCSVVK